MSNILKHHVEPEKPLVYEPPDLHGRKHVEKITGEFRYREDECLADKLQSEEFNKYFENNKLARRVGKMDIETAKMIFMKEVEESGLLNSLQLKELCCNDSFVAEELTRRIEKELDMESERKIAREMQDEEFARYLQAKEKKKLIEDRNIRLQRRLAEERRLQLLQQEEIITESRNNDYEVDATESKTYVESQRFRDEEQKKADEENDRWIAIRLQNEEALKYKRAKAEKQRRKRECNNKNTSDEASHVNSESSQLLHNDIHAKQPLSVDGFENYTSQDIDQSHQEQQVPCEEESNGEHIYLKSIDACGYPNESLCQDLVQSPDQNNLKFRQLQRRRNQSNENVDECLFKEDDAILNYQLKSNNLQSSKVLTQPVSCTFYDPDNPIAVRNVKRPSVKEQKKKKKWFSTK